MVKQSYWLSRDSILSPLESVDLDIEFQALTTAARGRHVLSRDSILSPLESVDLDAVNRNVGGSNPPWGANLFIINHLNEGQKAFLPSRMFASLVLECCELLRCQ